MNEITTTRTPQIVAAEINSIKDQTRTMILCNSIEIGRRLLEAKAMVGHGEWENWLKNSIDYSQRTASNLMRIFEEYGANQIALFGDNSKSQALADLSYTQAITLLGVPAEDREQFVKDNDINSMTTRELQEAIKAQKEAEFRAENAETREKELELSIDAHKKSSVEAQRKAEEAEKAKETIVKDKQVADQKVKELEKALEFEKKQVKLDLKTAKNNEKSTQKLSELEKQLKEAQDQVQELTDKINEPVILEPAIIEKVPEAIEQELNDLREKTKELEEKQQNNTAILKYGVHFEALISGFKTLLGSLAEIKEANPEEHEKYRKTVMGLLGKMSERL